MKLNTLAVFTIITFYLACFSSCFNETQRHSLWRGMWCLYRD